MFAFSWVIYQVKTVVIIGKHNQKSQICQFYWTVTEDFNGCRKKKIYHPESDVMKPGEATSWGGFAWRCFQPKSKPQIRSPIRSLRFVRGFKMAASVWSPSLSLSLRFENAHRPYALTSSSRHLRGKEVTKQSRRTDLYVRRTVLANEQPPFDL